MKKVDFLNILTKTLGKLKNKSYKSLILKCADLRPSQSWKKMIMLQLAIGVMVIAIIARSKEISFLKSNVAFTTTLFLTLVTLIAGFLTLSEKAKKWLDSSDD